MLTENYFQFWIYTDQIRNKNYKNLSKRNFALSKIDNLYEYFLPIFVIFIEQIIVRKIETSGSHSGYRFDLSFFCPLIMIEVNRLYDHLIKLSLMIVGTFQDTCSALCCHSSDQSERERERGDFKLRSGWFCCLRANQLIERYWLSLSLLSDRWLTGYPLHSDVPRNNERQLGSLAAGLAWALLLFPWSCFIEMKFSPYKGFLLALRKQQRGAPRVAGRVLSAQDFWKTSRVFWLLRRRRRGEMRDDDGWRHLVTI